MIEIIKKTLFAGLGATVITGERLRARLDELVEKGRISANEAEDMAGKIMAEGRKEFEEGSSRISYMLDEMMRKANFARQKDFEELASRVARLESRLQPAGPATFPTTTPPQPDARTHPPSHPEVGDVGTPGTIPPPVPKS
jgi:polyhydroxyalkanoate synthesis regulator phasin